jgi:predicted Zn-dependent protease
VIVGGKFIHPPLRFAFEVPSGYKLVNLPDVVAIKGPKGTLGNLTLASPQPSGSLTAAMQNYDPKGRIVFDNIENFTINGMEAATAVTRVNTKSGNANYRAVLIRHPSGKVYEFVFLSLADLGARHDGEFQKIATSFRQINASEAQQFNKAQRIRIVTVKAGDTVQSLSSKMVVADDKEGWFRVLNGLTNGQQVQAGQKVKIVAY